MKYRGLVISHRGNVRLNNEDNAYMNKYYRRDDKENFWTYQDVKEDSMLTAVFDGMGGATNGEVASRMAAEVLVETEQNSDKQNFSENVDAYVAKTSHKIAQYNSNSDIGTTCVILSIENNTVHFFNLGDSRGYLFRSRKLRQMTKDHNMIQEMVRQGILTKEQADKHPDRHAIYQYLGIKEYDEMVKLEIFCADSGEAERGDVYILCSDGLTDMLCDNEIENILNGNVLIEDKIIELFKQTLKKGGKDNVTIVAVEAE